MSRGDRLAPASPQQAAFDLLVEFQAVTASLAQDSSKVARIVAYTRNADDG